MAATAQYWQRGEALDYKNNTTKVIPAGAIITIGSRLGVAGTEIAPGQMGSLHMGGIWTIKKTGTAAIEMGQTVYFDGTGITDTKGGSGDSSISVEAGYAAAPAGAEDSTILVKLRG